MKKTLVALAALATVGAAFAQSSVTLYGKIDWEIQSNRPSVTNAAGVTTNGNTGLRVQSAGLNGSRFGLKGSEDLGGGLSAIFDLQGGIAVDTGQIAQCGGANVASVSACSSVTGAAGTVTTSQANRIFGRQAYAGLKGGFGQISAGRQYAPYDNAFGALDAQGYTTNSAMGTVFASRGVAGVANSGGAHADANDAGRVDNQVTYYTPAMGGFNAQVSWAPGENKAPGVSASRYYGLGLGYANGPINVQFAYEGLKSNGVVGVTGPSNGPAGTTDAWILGGSYNFGVASLYAAYERAENPANTKDKGWSLGVAVPLGTSTLSVGYARENSDYVVGPDTHSKGFGGQLTYPLSKRTFVYTEVLSVKNTISGSLAQSRVRTFGVGMQHNF